MQTETRAQPRSCSFQNQRMLSAKSDVATHGSIPVWRHSRMASESPTHMLNPPSRLLKRASGKAATPQIADQASCQSTSFQPRLDDQILNSDPDVSFMSHLVVPK